MNSKDFRTNPLFLRNAYEGKGRWNIPLVRNQNINVTDIDFIACSEARSRDNKLNRTKGVHFFVDDYRFEGIYNNPMRSLGKYSQYAFLLTPDFSTYADMDLWRQLENVAKNRWVGAFWQANGLKVIPTISWSTPRSFEFCFDGLEENGIVAVSTLKCKKSKLQFMRGYNMMLKKLNPHTIICYDEPFPEMEGNIIKVDYRPNGKEVG